MCCALFRIKLTAKFLFIKVAQLKALATTGTPLVSISLLIIINDSFYCSQEIVDVMVQ